MSEEDKGYNPDLDADYVKVLTASGSAYILDPKKMTWRRERIIPDGPSPNPMRTQEGTIDKWPELRQGESMILICPPLVEGTDGRAIITSPVAEVELGWS
jgi:hypothetical protein